MNSIGGRNQILVRTRDGDFHGIDGTTQAPWNYDEATAPRADYGNAVIGVPGALAGLLKLQAIAGKVSRMTGIEFEIYGFDVAEGMCLSSPSILHFIILEKILS